MSMPATHNAVEDSLEAVPRYRVVHPLAIASVVAGAFSILTAFSWYLLAIPIIGLVLGRQAIKRIRLAPEELTGTDLAWLGIGLSTGLWILGGGWLLFAEVREVPLSYKRITYDTIQPDPNAPADPIPQSALDLQDRKVYIRGFMQAGRRQTGIKDFILCPSNGDCQFCTPNPTPTEMIRITLTGDRETSYTTRQIGVAGRFQVDPANPSGIPYEIKAEILR
jgi:hypothetical protein